MNKTTTTFAFITQMRAVSDTFQDDWHDGCSGHTDIYAAIGCKDQSENALSGADTSPAAVTYRTFGMERLKQLGPTGRFELRVVKRTVTTSDEVIDGVGAEQAGADNAR